MKFRVIASEKILKDLKNSINRRKRIDRTLEKLEELSNST